MQHSYPIHSLVDAIQERHRALSSPEWIQEISREACQQLRERGLPKRGFEDWKYTSLRAVAETTWRFADHTPTSDQLQAHAIRGAINLAFVNGIFRPDLSDVANVSGLSIELLKHDGPSTWENPSAEVVEQLSRAVASQFLSVRTDADARIDRLVHFIHLGLGDNGLGGCRIQVDAAKGSSLKLVESAVQIGDALNLQASTMQIHVADRAEVKFYRATQLQDKGTNLTKTAVRLGRDSRFSCGSFAFGGKLNRHELIVALQQPGATIDLFGLYMLDHDQLVDNFVVVDHQAPHCSSQQFYKGILDGNGHGVFNGKVLVRPKAQQTNAQQLNKNLLLSSTAEVDAKPQLEIEADDVKCSHGAAIGQLDAEELFYLQSRGIPQDRARKILSHAFADEVIQRVDDADLAIHFREMLARHFKGKQ